VRHVLRSNAQSRWNSQAERIKNSCGATPPHHAGLNEAGWGDKLGVCTTRREGEDWPLKRHRDAAVDRRQACIRRSCGFLAADCAMCWPSGHPPSPLPRTLFHPQGAASPCRRTDEAAAAPVESEGKPAQAGSRWPSPLGPEGLHEDQGAPARRAPGSVTWFFDSQMLTDLSSYPCGIACARVGPEPLSGLCEQMTVAGAQQAVRADCDASIRQDVLQGNDA